MTPERSQIFWPDTTDVPGPDGTPPRLPVQRTNPHARICANCLSLAHMWSVPRVEDIELPVIHERYGLTMYYCVCHCGCPAVMTTVGPAIGPEPKRPGGGDNVR
jgi:hypothetical protein